MRAVGALLSLRLDQATRFGPLEHPVQQQVLNPTGDKACAELRQYAEMKARVGQIERKPIFQSMRPRTASAACRSLRCSRN